MAPTDEQARSSAGDLSIGASRWRRMLVCGALLVSLAVSGCAGGPSSYENALVVHVVAPRCEHEPGHQPLLVVERVVEGFGKATVNEWRTLRRLKQCGTPFAGHSWEGEVLQVWMSDYEWRRRKHLRLQLGHRMVEANTWAVADEDRQRLDYQHVFLGTIDVGADGAEYVPPAAVEAIGAQLEDRQGCDTRHEKEYRATPCTDEWRHADLFTLAVAEEAPVSPWPSDPPPRTEKDANG